MHKFEVTIVHPIEVSFPTQAYTMSRVRQHGTNCSNGMQLLGASSSGDTDPLYENDDRPPARFQFYCKEDFEVAGDHGDDEDAESTRKSFYNLGKVNDEDGATQATAGSRSTVLPEHQATDFRPRGNNRKYAGYSGEGSDRDNQWVDSRQKHEPNVREQHQQQEPFYQQKGNLELEEHDKLHNHNYHQEQEWEDQQQNEHHQPQHQEEQQQDVVSVFTFEGSPEPTRSKSHDYNDDAPEEEQFRAAHNGSDEQLTREERDELSVSEHFTNAVTESDNITRAYVEQREDSVEVQNAIEVGTQIGEQGGVESTDRLFQANPFRGDFDTERSVGCHRGSYENDQRIQQTHPRECYEEANTELPNSAFRQFGMMPRQIAHHEVASRVETYPHAVGPEANRKHDRCPQIGSPRSEWRSEHTPGPHLSKNSAGFSQSLSQDDVSMVFEIVQTPEKKSIETVPHMGYKNGQQGVSPTVAEDRCSASSIMGAHQFRCSSGDDGDVVRLDGGNQSPGNIHSYRSHSSGSAFSQREYASPQQAWAREKHEPLSDGWVRGVQSNVNGHVASKGNSSEQEQPSGSNQAESKVTQRSLRVKSQAQQSLASDEGKSKSNHDESTSPVEERVLMEEKQVSERQIIRQREDGEEPPEADISDVRADHFALDNEAEVTTLRTKLTESESKLVELQKENQLLREREFQQDIKRETCVITEKERETETKINTLQKANEDLCHRMQSSTQHYNEEVATWKNRVHFQESTIFSLREDVVQLEDSSRRRGEEFEEKISTISKELAKAREAAAAVEIQSAPTYLQVAKEAREKLEGVLRVVSILEHALAIKEELASKLQKQVSDMASQLRNSDSNDLAVSLKQQVDHLLNRCGTLEECVKEHQERAEDMTETERTHRPQLKTLQEDLEQRTEMTYSLEAKLAEMTEERSGKILVNKDEYEEMEADIQETLEKYDFIQATNTELKETITDLQLGQAVDLSTMKELDRKMHILESKLKETNNEKERYANDRKTAMEENTKLSNALSELKERVFGQDDMSSHIANLEKAVASLEEQNASLNEECEKARQEEAELKQSTAQLVNHQERDSICVDSLEGNIRELQGLNDKLEDENKAMLEQLKSAAREDPIQQNCEVEERLSYLERENEDLRHQYSYDVHRLENDLNITVHKKQELEKRLREKSKLLAKAESRMAALNSTTLESVMEALSKGKAKPSKTSSRTKIQK